MAIKPPPLKTTPAKLSDWIELTVLASEENFFRLSVLKRFWDTHRETEDSDPEGRHRREDDTDDDGVGGADDDAFLDSITDELADRSNALGSTYPFYADDTGKKLLLRDELTSGAYIYIFCLLLSNSKADEILDGSWLPNIDHKTRDLFQVCSTLAAAGEVRGSSISFGWPRPNDNPPFLKKLRDVYALFGEGEVVAEPRKGVSPSPKDAEIDIIAWRPTPDRAAGTEYMLGQVASGDNWEAKSILGGPIKDFHQNWFTQQPASEAKASIFIPHEIQSVGEGSRRDRMHVQVVRYGTIFDRLRLPLKAAEGINLAELNHDLTIERHEEMPNVITWVNEQLSNLRTIYLASMNA